MRLAKAFEDAGLLLGRHADAGVADAELDTPRAGAHAQAHRALVGELQGIAQQVDEHLAQALAIRLADLIAAKS
mgnify:CR=1 FL=1